MVAIGRGRTECISKKEKRSNVERNNTRKNDGVVKKMSKTCLDCPLRDTEDCYLHIPIGCEMYRQQLCEQVIALAHDCKAIWDDEEIRETLTNRGKKLAFLI